jgi:hypothetical protein
MSNKTVQAESFFGATMPATGPIGAGPISLAYWFELDVDAWLMGFRSAQKAGDKNPCVFQVWNTSSSLIAMQAPSAKRVELPLAADGWSQIWCRPRIELSAATPYLVVYSAFVDVFSDIGRMATGPLISGHITIPLMDAVNPGNQNGSYVQPPNLGDPTALTSTGNFYGLDVLVLPK